MKGHEWAEAHRAARLWRSIKTSFPFLPKPTILSRHAEDIYDAVSELLARVPSFGTIAGTKLPAPALPPLARRRHLYVVGKTGSGKTTFLEHLIAEDLDAGRGVGVFSPESGFFRERLLPLVPTERLDEVIYFAPADPACPVTLNPLSLEPGDDASRAAQDLATIFRRVLGEVDLGVRGEPILENLCAALVACPGLTLVDAPRFLQDAQVRTAVLSEVASERTREFWQETYPRFPKSSELPVLTRLDRFLRSPNVRRVLCQPHSTLSIRSVLRRRSVLFVDLYGLSEPVRQLLGQVLLARLQLELMRRERASERASSFFLYTDEFQEFGSSDERTWRELLSRGRKYGVALTLAHQYPAQLPEGLQREVRNANSSLAFRLAYRDAESMRGEFLREVVRAEEERLEPLPASAFVELPVGVAYASLCGGRAVKIEVPPPPAVAESRASRVVERSWRRLRDAASRTPEPARPVAPARESGAVVAEPTGAKRGHDADGPPAKESPEPVTKPEQPAVSTSGSASARVSKEFLDYLASVAEEPFLATTERDRVLGLSAWKGNRLRGQIVEDGLARLVAINPGGRGRKFHLLELSTDGRALLGRYGVRDPAGRGRGGLVHQWWCHTIAEWLSTQGVACMIEEDANGARVDVAATIADGVRLAVEVEMSEGHELENIRKDLDAGFERVVSLVGSADAAKRLRQALAGDTARVDVGILQEHRELLTGVLTDLDGEPTTLNRSTPAARPADRDAQADDDARTPVLEGLQQTPLASSRPPPLAATLNTHQAAEYLGGISPRTLEGFRSRGGGPRFVRLGRRVAYRREDLDRWLEERSRRSTSDTGSATV